MSEYQYVGFRAVDAPLNDKQLKYAESQSSHADVSRWSFEVEYDYGEFRGDADELLRNGYDIFLLYTNYGDREIKLRLPSGLPFEKDVWEKYVDGEQLNWKKDAKGSGGILTLKPYHESGDLDVVFEFQTYLDAAILVRERLMTGDLRPLYLLWLCGADDYNNDPAEMIEPPVPHGIVEAAKYGDEILEFYGLDPLLLTAAGQGVGGAPADNYQDQAARWVKALDEQTAKEMLLKILAGDTVSEKAHLLATIRDSQSSGGWPTTDKQRTFEELLQKTEALRDVENAKRARKAEVKAKRDAEKADQERADRMKEMRKDPNKWLRESERLVDAGGTSNYKTAAEILYDLRKAIGGDEGSKITRSQAVKLARNHPTLNLLKSSLRKRGLLD